MYNPILEIEGVTFEDMVDWLMLPKDRVRVLLELDQIEAVKGFDGKFEYNVSLLRGENHYGSKY